MDRCLFRLSGTVLQQDITLRTVVTDLATAQPFTHLYFVYVIAGLYLLTPLLLPFVAAHGRRATAIAAALLLGMWATQSLFPYVLHTGSPVTGLTYWLPFLGYFMAGSALMGLRMSDRVALTILVGIVVVIALQILTVYLLAISSDGAWTNYPGSYWSPFTIAAAVGIFALAARDTPRQFPPQRVARTARALGEATFGVYLVHEMLLYLHAINFVHGSPSALVTARIPTYVFAVVGSFVIVLVVKRIPVLRFIF